MSFATLGGSCSGAIRNVVFTHAVFCKKSGSLRREVRSSHGPVSGTTKTRKQVDVDDRVPVPTTVMETVAEDPHPAASVLLPLSPLATLTTVSAGALPLPAQARLTEM